MNKTSALVVPKVADNRGLHCAGDSFFLLGRQLIRVLPVGQTHGDLAMGKVELAVAQERVLLEQLIKFSHLKEDDCVVIDLLDVPVLLRVCLQTRPFGKQHPDKHHRKTSGRQLTEEFWTRKT